MQLIPMHFRSLPKPQIGLNYQIPFLVPPTPARKFADMLFFICTTRHEESEQIYGEAGIFNRRTCEEKFSVLRAVFRSSTWLIGVREDGICGIVISQPYKLTYNEILYPTS